MKMREQRNELSGLRASEIVAGMQAHTQQTGIR